MIRLLLTLVACVVLQPAAAPARAHGQTPPQATIGVAGAARVALPAPAWAWHAAVVAPSLVVAVPAWGVADAATPSSHSEVARLWLRASRLLC